jgi:hypothetical protein
MCGGRACPCAQTDRVRDGPLQHARDLKGWSEVLANNFNAVSVSLPAAIAVTEPVSGAVAGAVVPRRTGDMAASALAPDYQQILSVLESEAGREGMRCQQLAVALGLDAVPAKVEGLRSKAKRLVERGWALQVRPGVFTAPAVPAV